MNFLIIFIIILVILISAISTIVVIKSEHKKDIEFLNKRKLHKESQKINYKEYLESPHWKETRLKALDRAGYRCQLCCSKVDLNVHHNTYKNLNNEDPKDLFVLCRKCHAKFHDKPY